MLQSIGSQRVRHNLAITITTNKNLLYSTRNSIQYSVMAYMGKESKYEWIHVYVNQIHYAILLKLIEHCKPTISQ